MFIVSEGISLKIISKETLQVDSRTKMIIKEMCEIVKLLAKSKLKSLPYNHTAHPPTQPAHVLLISTKKK